VRGDVLTDRREALLGAQLVRALHGGCDHVARNRVAVKSADAPVRERGLRRLPF
jgi:hypothetical protein